MAGSHLPALSADGRSVAFMSLASDLGPGDDNSTWTFTWRREMFTAPGGP